MGMSRECVRFSTATPNGTNATNTTSGTKSKTSKQPTEANESSNSNSSKPVCVETSISSSESIEASIAATASAILMSPTSKPSPSNISPKSEAKKSAKKRNGSPTSVSSLLSMKREAATDEVKLEPFHSQAGATLIGSISPKNGQILIKSPVYLQSMNGGTTISQQQSIISTPTNQIINITSSSELPITASPKNNIIDSAVKQLSLCDKILSIAQSHQVSSPYTQLKHEQLFSTTLKLKKHLSLSLPSNVLLDSTNSNCSNVEEMQRLEMWRCLCALIGPDITRIVDFAKRIPGRLSFF